MTSVIEINGNKIKNIRKALKLTQKDLAIGICSQSTISNIENRNFSDSIEILSRICHRLNIRIEDVLKEDNNFMLTQLLDQLRDLTMIGNHNEANRLLKLFIQNHSLNDTVEDTQEHVKFNYYKGLLVMLVENRPLDSIFFFQKVLDSNLEDKNLVKILTINTLGIAYNLLEKNDQAKYYIDRSLKMIEENNVNDIELGKVYYNSANFYSKIKEPQIAVNLCYTGIDICKKNHSTVTLDYLFYELSFNLNILGDITAKNKYHKALFLTTLTNNYHLEEIIKKDIVQNFE